MLALLPVLFLAGTLAAPHLRQMPTVPSSCSSQCAPVNSVFSACVSGDTQTCLSVCTPSTFSQFSTCVNCVAGADGISASAKTQLQQVLDSMTSACAQLNSMGGASAAASGSNATGAGASVSGAGANVSSGVSASASGSGANSSAAGASGAASGVVSAVAGASGGASGAGASGGAAASGGGAGGASAPTSPSGLITNSTKVTGSGAAPSGGTTAQPNGAATATTYTPLLFLGALLAAFL
ncbi:uncharacterized protein LOC62_02G003129 [Vanrija pseudolonga]|uniref:Extracellular membrane protein CFEM domain-containing protein n=1 Tax=Vanrija pseudolonga TaxID=143232 RepID=A0AAF1BH11_9TREE|nr:hypothetical protein LOC62_02G003129 [Vanrija pseudolonga]